MESKTVTETMMESAACEALGANTAEESAAYQRQVADDGTGELRRLDRRLRTTASRLAAASPHLMPSADLRGRIVQATAPVTFKMEDYRKATREDFRFYKWGFYAAAVFLFMGALYNIDVGGKLNTANNRLVALQQKQQQLLSANQESNNALAAFIDPHSVQLTWQENGQTFGRGIVNVASHKAVLIFPQELMPNGTRPQLTMNVGGKDVPFETSLITAPAVQIGLVVPANAPDFARKPNVEKLAPDTGNKIDVAGFNK